MKKLLAWTAALSLLATLGCAQVFSPLPGLVFSSVKHPGRYEPGETTNPGGATITGESCAMSILGLISLGDWSVEAALKAAGAEGKTLKNVAVDHPSFNVLGLYSKVCTRVYAQVAQ